MHNIPLGRSVGVLLLAAAICAGGAASAAAQASCPFAAGDLPATTLPPGSPHGGQIPIDHIVVLMQENRSFDHYLGKLHKRHSDGLPRHASNPDPLGGAPIESFHQEAYCEVADLSHSWNGTHLSWNGGAMDGFTAVNTHPADPSGSRTMGYYKFRDLRYYHRLYRLFASADRYFSSLLGPTFPNRFYLVAGSSFGHIRNDLPPNTSEYSQPTIFDQLDAAGVSWKIYAVAISENLVFASVRAQAGTKIKPMPDYFADAASGNLPAVSFVEPNYFGTVNTQSDEHPPANVQVGEAFAAGVIDALLASPAWPSSALFLIYDEHGGFYDHVPPPPACVPDAIPPLLQASDVVANFDRYGIRVPAVVVSPFARRRFVSHTVYDHTSVLRFIQTRFDLPALTARDANADPMLEMFDFANPPYLRPPRLHDAVVDPDGVTECALLHP